MKYYVRGQNFINEEKKAVRLFLVLFYSVFIFYDVFYYYLYPKFAHEVVGIPDGGFGYWYYVFIILFFPVGIYLYQSAKPFAVKYVFTIGFIFVDTINCILILLSGPNDFSSGNLLEVILILFSPIFINKRYFYTVTFGVIGKYILLALTLKQSILILPALVLAVIAMISFILLTRFLSYISTVGRAFVEVREKEKFAYIGQMASTIGHEIRNPLSALRGFTQLQQERDNSETNFYPIMIEEIDRINTIVDDLMILGKPKSPNFKQHEINKIIDYVTTVTNQLAERSGSKIIVKNCETNPTVECDEKQIKQALLNIIKNAIESMIHNGTVEVICTCDIKDKVKITVKDQGCGLDEKELENLWEPFYTTKQDGTGLGLLVTKKIIEDHQGELDFKSKKDEGTTVEILLPLRHIHNN